MTAKLVANMSCYSIPLKKGNSLWANMGQGGKWRHTILSRASKAGSPTNRPGSDKTRGQGSFGLSTGGPDLRGSLQPAESKMSTLGNHLDKKI